MFLSVSMFGQSDTLVIRSQDYNFDSYHNDKQPKSFYLKSNSDSILNGNFRLIRTNSWVEEFSLKNNMVHGVNRIYYAGALTQERNYKDGFLNGKLYTFHDSKDENGKLITGYIYKENTFCMGLQVDTAFTFDRDKWLTSLSYYNKEGNRHGLYATYYPGVKVETKGYFDNGKRVGEWFTYYEDGAINERIYYDAELATIDYFCFYADGSVQNETHKKDGVHVGKWAFYSQNGEAQYSNFYVDGYLRGPQVERNHNAIEEYFINDSGQRHGKYIQRDEQTKNIRVKGHFMNGLKVGIWKIVMADIGEVMEVEFVNGQNDAFYEITDSKYQFNNKAVLKRNGAYSVPLNNVESNEEQQRDRPKLFLFSE